MDKNPHNNTIRDHFFKGSHRFNLSLEDANQMTWEWQQKLLDATVNSDLNKKYPMSSQFTKHFLKKIMQHLESNNMEIHDEFFVNLCETMQNNNEDYCFKHYFIGTNTADVITMKETNKMVVNGTTGMKTWEAALMLADWALCNKTIFKNKNVIELGSGVGFSGLTIAKRCEPKSIHLTDCHPDVLKAIVNNVLINFPNADEKESTEGSIFMDVDSEIGVKYLDWNNSKDISNCLLPDVLIGADIVYDPEIIKPLCNVLKKFFERRKDMQVFIASTIRNPETFKMFLEILESMELLYIKLAFPNSVHVDWNHNTEKCLLKINHK